MDNLSRRVNKEMKSRDIQVSDVDEYGEETIKYSIRSEANAKARLWYMDLTLI